MTNGNLTDIRNRLIEHISSQVESNLMLNIEERYTDESIEMSLIEQFLSLIITLDGITVIYAYEHDDFWKETYNSLNSWITAAGDFIVLLLTHTITVDYFYLKKSEKILYYKIWHESKDNHRRFLKKVILTMNPIALLQPKTIVCKTLNLV